MHVYVHIYICIYVSLYIYIFIYILYGNISIIQCPGRYRPFMTWQSIASEASQASASSSHMNLHIRRAKIYT